MRARYSAWFHRGVLPGGEVLEMHGGPGPAAGTAANLGHLYSMGARCLAAAMRARGIVYLWAQTQPLQFNRLDGHMWHGHLRLEAEHRPDTV